MVEAKKPRGKRPAEGGYGRHREHRKRDGVTTTEISSAYKHEEWLARESEITKIDLTERIKQGLIASVEGDEED